MSESSTEKSHSEKMDEAGTPTFKSFVIYFLPLSPMNPALPFWMVGTLPAALYFVGIGIAPMRHYLLGAASADALLDSRPTWLQAIDCGERVVLAVIHLFVAMLHVSLAGNLKSEQGTAAAAEARALAFTDAPKGTAVMDGFQWPPGPYIERPVWYMRFHTLIDCLPFFAFASNPRKSSAAIRSACILSSFPL